MVRTDAGIDSWSLSKMSAIELTVSLARVGAAGSAEQLTGEGVTGTTSRTMKGHAPVERFSGQDHPVGPGIERAYERHVTHCEHLPRNVAGARPLA